MRDYESERSEIKENYIKKCAILGEKILHNILKQESIKDIANDCEKMSKDYDSLTLVINALEEVKPEIINPCPDVRFDADMGDDRDLMERLGHIIWNYERKWVEMNVGGIDWRAGLTEHYLKLIREEMK